MLIHVILDVLHSESWLLEMVNDLVQKSVILNHSIPFLSFSPKYRRQHGYREIKANRSVVESNQHTCYEP